MRLKSRACRRVKSRQFPVDLLSIVLVFTIIFCTGSSWKSQGTVQSSSGSTILDLNANRDEEIWKVTGKNGSQEIEVFATVPGGIYSDLEDAGLLPSEIYHDYNDLESKWVGRTNWTFFREFTVGSSLLQNGKIVLVCEGLDTVARISINGVRVGKGVNMFVRYIFDIKEHLKKGVNTIQIAFQSPVEYAAKEFSKHAEQKGYIIPPEDVVPQFKGEGKVQMMRKMPSSFSWDWGPSYPSSGIWKNIFIEGISTGVIRDVLIFTTPNKDVPDETKSTEWALTARVYLDIGSENDEGTLTLERVGGPERAEIRVKLFNSHASHDISILIPGDQVKMWWPNGYGKQHLCSYEVSYKSDNSNERSSKTVKVGFRTVELDQSFVVPKKPDMGRNFLFKVNGLPMYSKGSNSIPIHVLPEKVTPEATKWLLESAKDLHTNMIRVWGGGIYESDYFYDLADELGIFIWQDFMFACSLYPATDEFLLNVMAEVETQAKRLQRHPSLAIWAANNENEGALSGGWWSYIVSSRRETYKQDYIKLYVDTIIGNLSVWDPSRECLSSSPTNGIKTKEEGWLAHDPGSNLYGDIHHYDYYGDSWRASTFTYKRARYASEYGLQSFPYVETLRDVASDFKNWTWFSPMVEHRQRHPGGQGEMKNMISSHLPSPSNPDSPQAFPAMIYMSQIVQCMGQKTQTEHYRRLVDKLFPDGSGRNHGALYWQLNDIWQGASWASFEVSGRWKMMANYMARTLSPVITSPYLDGDDLIVSLVSDSLKDFQGNMGVRIFKLNNTQALISKSVPVRVEFLRSVRVFKIVKAYLDNLECGSNSNDGVPCLVYITLPGTPDNFLFLQYPTNPAHLRNPNLRATDYRISADWKTINFTLRSDAIAPFVFLNLRHSPHGKFSDNGFVLVDPSKEVSYQSRDPITLEVFTQELDIMSLFDVTSLSRSQ